MISQPRSILAKTSLQSARSGWRVLGDLLGGMTGRDRCDGNLASRAGTELGGKVVRIDLELLDIFEAGLKAVVDSGVVHHLINILTNENHKVGG